jgi:carbon-monoxide dehydrogenase large subunit
VIVRFEGRPSTRNPLGIKGLGELPSNGVPAAIANALADALGPGAPPLDPPFTAERVWRALRRPPVR